MKRPQRLNSTLLQLPIAPQVEDDVLAPISRQISDSYLLLMKGSQMKAKILTVPATIFFLVGSLTAYAQETLEKPKSIECAAADPESGTQSSIGSAKFMLPLATDDDGLGGPVQTVKDSTLVDLSYTFQVIDLKSDGVMVVGIVESANQYKGGFSNYLRQPAPEDYLTATVLIDEQTQRQIFCTFQ